MSTQTIESVMNEKRLFAPDAGFVKGANISGMPAYEALCAEAEKDFTGFWARLAREHIAWHQPFTKMLDESNAPFFKWFGDGKLNASYNCLDRHLATQPDKVAIIFEADDGTVSKVTYKELYRRVCIMANGLKSLRIKQGDRVIIYMPMSIEVVVTMQACARLGVVHSVVFGGFSAKSLQERIIDAGAVAVITADEQMRGGKALALKPAVDEAIAMGGCDTIQSVVVYRRTGGAEHPSVARGMHNLALWTIESGDPAPAERLLRETIELRRKVLGSEHPDVASTMTLLAGVLVDTQRYDEARSLAADARALSLKSLGANHWRTACATSTEGAALAGLEQYTRAEALLLESDAVLHGDTSTLSHCLRNSDRWLARLYQTTGRPEKAAKHPAHATRGK